jgi:hypothetical protein
MNYLSLTLTGAWKVLAAGLVLGAGLPVVYGLGLRALGIGTTTTADGATSKSTPVGKLVFAICLAIVFIGIILGLMFIIATGLGKQLVFEGIMPTIAPKK